MRGLRKSMEMVGHFLDTYSFCSGGWAKGEVLRCFVV